MIYKPTYESLDASKLLLEIKASGSVSVKLSKSRARLALEGVELLSIMLGKDIENSSIRKVMLSTLRYIIGYIRIRMFHKNLLQIFKFYYAYQPEFILENSEGDFCIINFLREEKHSLMN